jgi:hypothetical protein
MKKATLILSLLLASSLAFSQSKVEKDANGNYVQISASKRASEDKPLGKTFTTSKGETYPIYVSERGKYYIIRTSKETGNQYKQYLKLEN